MNGGSTLLEFADYKLIYKETKLIHIKQRGKNQSLTVRKILERLCEGCMRRISMGTGKDLSGEKSISKGQRRKLAQGLCMCVAPGCQYIWEVRNLRGMVSIFMT